VIGYLGAIQYWIDLPLLGRIARLHPDWTLVLVGPPSMMANMSVLDGLPNVIITGRVPYEDVPRYVKAFDVCVNPYILDGVAEHCSPLKLYEYLATGKPIVSVDMPEARKFASLIAIASDADAFVKLVEQAVDSPDGRNGERMAEARNHTWIDRYRAATGLLLEIRE
jgi:glycosyltransferase involved in cell wall biosynthesis